MTIQFTRNRVNKRWAYGVIAVKERLELLKQTLDSLGNAGFHNPRLFIDGLSCEDLAHIGLAYPITFRNWPHIGGTGNWMLGMLELYIRHPTADVYAMFEDDIICCFNIRRYLTHCIIPPLSYLNLYTDFKSHEKVKHLQEQGIKGWVPSCQTGRGALALVFPRPTLMELFTQHNYIAKPQDHLRGRKCIDGMVAQAITVAGGTEYIHSYSFVQHTGDDSVMVPGKQHVPAPHFLGERFDAIDLLGG